MSKALPIQVGERIRERTEYTPNDNMWSLEMDGEGKPMVRIQPPSQPINGQGWFIESQTLVDATGRLLVPAQQKIVIVNF